MELQSCIDAVVHTGIQAYIGLLCCGERARSRRLFADTMQISSLAAGGPSARLPGAHSAAASLGGVMIFFTLRSLLSSLLVLRATAYWSRVPSLVELQEACIALSRCLGTTVPRAIGSRAGEARDDDDAVGYASRA